MQYEVLIGNVADGYDDYLAEYYNDLSCRNFIDLVLEDGAAGAFVEFSSFADKVAALDIEFRSLLTPEPMAPGNFWWNTHLPLRAGARLRDEMRVLFDYQAQPSAA